MIDRERNGMAKLLRELKRGIRVEIDESRRGANTNSESDEKSRDGEEDSTTYYGRIPLVLECPGTVTTHVLCQVSPTLDETSRMIFALSRSRS